MHSRIATIASYTTLEALSTRFALLAIAVIAITLAASFFVRELAITDSTRFQTAFYAAGARFAMAFLASLYAIASVSREFQDKGLDVTLALDVPRSHYVVGKLVGFLAIGLALAIFAALPLIAAGLTTTNSDGFDTVSADCEKGISNHIRPSIAPE